MKLSMIILAACLLCGCHDEKKDGQAKPKPPADDVQRVPDAPSTLQLSGIAGCALALYALSTRKEREA